MKSTYEPGIKIYEKGDVIDNFELAVTNIG